MWWKGWNGFDKCTWSKYELELENNFSSLDVLFIRIGKKLRLQYVENQLIAIFFSTGYHLHLIRGSKLL